MVCRDAWCLVYGIKKNRLRRVLRDVKDGKLEYVHGNKGVRRMAEKIGDSMAWLTKFGQLCGRSSARQEQDPFAILLHKNCLVQENKSRV